MPEPFRLRLMTALSDQLKTITRADGYSFDLNDYTDAHGRPAERVFRGRDIFGANDALPLLAVLEDPRSEPSDNGSDGRAAINKFRVLIQGFLRTDELDMHPLDDAYRLSAEVTKALVARKRDMLGLRGRVTAMTIGQPVHRPGRDEISDNAYMLLGVTFTVVENMDDPYA